MRFIQIQHYPQQKAEGIQQSEKKACYRYEMHLIDEDAGTNILFMEADDYSTEHRQIDLSKTELRKLKAKAAQLAEFADVIVEEVTMRSVEKTVTVWEPVSPGTRL